MIAERMQRDINALRRQIGPFAHRLPPLVLPLLDNLEERVEDVARLQDAAYINLEDLNTMHGGEHEQPRQS